MLDGSRFTASRKGIHSNTATNLCVALEGYVGRSMLSEFALSYYAAYVALESLFDWY